VGLGDAPAENLEAAARVAYAIAARSVFASYPDRDVRDRPGTVEVIALELRIVPAPPTPPTIARTTE
ncbi:MAG: hypothetical protein L3J91_00270, partial [Thermoplasmata archaeon]|nr:hypothetical protein [Thermoplasmata archaeon]